MKIITQIRFYLVIVTLSFLGLLVNYLNLQDELTKCKTDKYSIQGGDIRLNDLHDSLFILTTNLGRYEIALDILKEEDSVAAQKFENILYTKTE
jgi:hypothetical protein